MSDSDEFVIGKEKGKKKVNKIGKKQKRLVEGTEVEDDNEGESEDRDS